tara:strand:- start:571 stop:765 length:195 start_codon:yes stop_codon:yes gene_type:complete
MRPLETSDSRDSNWFVLKVESQRFVKQYTNDCEDTPVVKLLWWARERDSTLMLDYHADPTTYTP